MVWSRWLSSKPGGRSFWLRSSADPPAVRAGLVPRSFSQTPARPQMRGFRIVMGRGTIAPSREEVPLASPDSPTRPLTGTEWLIAAMAALGFAFDIYVLLVLPLIVGPALAELTGATAGTPEFNRWVGLLFWLPAIAGGIFGLLGGYLTDLFGRRRVLVWSILLYAFSAVATGYATSA